MVVAERPLVKIEPIYGQAALLADYAASTLAAIAGTGGGKTILGYWWLYTRMQKFPGYGWGLAEPTHGMLSKIIVNSPDPERPNLIDWLRSYGLQPHYKAVDKIVETNLGKIYLGSADNPDSMQGPALKGYWLDESGMMHLLAYQTAVQRVSFYDGQVLNTTTPYNRGWLKTEVADKADGNYIHVEKWRSIDNPRFPKHVYYELRDGPNAMQKHRFDMMYNASFERPVGMIYDAFNDERCVIPPFKIPKSWPRYVGIDFGGVNMAVIWFAKNPVRYKSWPANTLFGYREYLEGNKSVANHVAVLKHLSKGEDIVMKAGGAKSEQHWRREFTEAGWHVQQPKISDVEVGIDRVYGFHSQDKICYFDTMRLTLAEKADYHRKLDENQLPTEVIDNKEKYHLLDGERYIISNIAGRRPAFELT